MTTFTKTGMHEMSVSGVGWGWCHRARDGGSSPTLRLIAAILVAGAVVGAGAGADESVAYYGYRVVETYPHDPRAFTQGLAYHDGHVYEGTGLYGESAILRRELKTGKLVKRLRLNRKYFGEGVTLVGDKVVQLTWKAGKGFVYDRETFRPLKEFKYAGQGWGIAHDGKRLTLSDGTATLRFLDPNTYAETQRLVVEDRGRRIRGLNELEFIGKQLYANVYGTDYIAIIDPCTGRVTGWVNLTGLCPLPKGRRPSNAVLNGIAYIPKTKRLLVTGKLWPKLFEIELVPQSIKPPGQ
jgi:glutamine cyclotransferase